MEVGGGRLCLPVRPLIPQGFWLVGAVRLHWEQGQPAAAATPVSGTGFREQDSSQIPQRSCGTVRSSLAPTGPWVTFTPSFLQQDNMSDFLTNPGIP